MSLDAIYAKFLCSSIVHSFSYGFKSFFCYEKITKRTFFSVFHWRARVYKAGKAWFSYAADLPGTWPPTWPAGGNCGLCEHLSPTHNLSQALIAGLPAKLNSTQLRRKVGGQCLGQIVCRRSAGDKCSHMPQLSQAVSAAMSQVDRRHMRTRLNHNWEL